MLTVSSHAVKALYLVLADVDHFKLINDSLGHPVGDRVLQRLAMIFKAGTREDDIVARWGGEEFLVLQTAASIEEARMICERLRAAVQGGDWQSVSPGLRVTISLRLGRVSRDEPKQALLERIDAALYRAKREGRNRVVVADAAASAAVAGSVRAG